MCKKTKVLFVSFFYPYPKIKNGGDVVSHSHFKLIERRADSISVLSLKRRITLLNKAKKLFFSFFGWYWPVTPYFLFCLSCKIKKEKINLIYLDGSRLGHISKYAKKKFPNIKVITFFHNIEVLYLEARDGKGTLRKPLLSSVKNSEVSAVTYSDVCAFITSRDLNFYSDKIKGKSTILPVSVIDRFKEKNINVGSTSKSDFMLFFGSSFYANLEGIRWFIDYVMPYVNIPLYVVGKGFEKYSKELSRKNVVIVGSVDNSDKYFYQAICVVAPIFSGSGMKVKTAEAMLFGKKILATSESLIGYSDTVKEVVRCDSASSFINEISNIVSGKKFFSEVRQEYLKKYSFESLDEKMLTTLND